MRLDFGTIAGCAGFIFATLALIVFWLHRRDAMLAAEEMRESVAADTRKRNAECAGQLDALKRDLATLELSMQNTQEILRDGRLSRSARSQALNLLRSGVSPETAAATLGLARREVKLLARVSQMFALR